MKKIAYAGALGCSVSAVAVIEGFNVASVTPYDGYSFYLDGFDISLNSSTPATPVSSLVGVQISTDGRGSSFDLVMQPDQNNLVYRQIHGLNGAFLSNASPEVQSVINFTFTMLSAGGTDAYSAAINYWGYLVKN